MKSELDINFDYWVALYQRNPEHFERQREKLVNDFIEHSNADVRRLRGIQFRIDVERNRSKNPMGACLRVSRLMLDHFYNEFVPIFNDHNL